MPNPFEDGNLAWFWYETWLAGIAAVFALVAAVHAGAASRSRRLGTARAGVLALGFIATAPLAIERIGIDLGGREDVMAVFSFPGALGAAIYAAFESRAIKLKHWFRGGHGPIAVAAGSATTGGGSVATGRGATGGGSGAGPGANAAVPAWLHFRSGPAAGQSVPLAPGVTSIGRDRSNNLVIDDPNVSRRHAEIELRNGRYSLRDAGSSGGTLFDGRSVDGEQVLVSGTTIKLGNTELVFTAAEAVTEFMSSGEVKVRATTVDAIRPAETVIGSAADDDRLVAWLAVTSGSAKGQICRLSADRTTIGRDGSNDLVVNDPAVSRSHAVVVARDDDLVLVDLGSTGGTSVNGRSISGRPVKHGARLRVGDTELELVAVESSVPARAAGGGDMTVVDTPSSGGVVVVRSGADAGRTFNLQDGDNLVGRDRDAVVELSDASVSRRHAIIRKQANGYVLYDLASKTGTYADGAKLAGARLKPGDRITVGRTELSFMRPNGA